MSNTDYEAIMHRFVPNGSANLDRNHVQRELTLDFIAALQQRGDKTVNEITEQFGVQYSGVLSWLGHARQDMMLIDAMAMTGIDLTHWLEESEGK